MSSEFGAQFYAYMQGIFRKRDDTEVLTLIRDLKRQLKKRKLLSDGPSSLFQAQVLSLVARRLDMDMEHPRFWYVSAYALHILYVEDYFAVPEINWRKTQTTSDWWELRNQVSRLIDLVEDYDDWVIRLSDAIAEIVRAVRSAAPQFFDSEDDRETSLDQRMVFDVSLYSVLDKPKEMLDRILDAGLKRREEKEFLLPRIGSLLEQNLVKVSGHNPNDPASYQKQFLYPTKSKLENAQALVETYLKPTGLHGLFEETVPFTLPEKTRFEHHHIVAGSGHGKTQTLQYLIAHDLQKVAEGDASVVVIDSQGDLIRNILDLEIVNEDNLVLIDPTDFEFPVCLNLFDVQMDRINAYSRLHREQMLNGILELYDFVLGALLGAEMTQKQSVIFRYVTLLMLYVPDATIHTMLELFQDGGSRRYAEHIKKLEGSARMFFETEFEGAEFKATKRQVVRRLYGILENQTFNRMFSHPRSKLDLFSEMNEGKVILINTAKDLLKETGTEIFGRFFIAMIAQAAQERATLKENERMPTFVYIDEAQEYFDQNIETILSQARKYNVGMVMAHQYLDQLSPRLQSAFMSNTSIKMVGGMSVKDARAFASEFRTDAEFIAAQPKGSFATSIRGQTKSAVSFDIPFGHMENLEKQDQRSKDDLISYMRHRYAVPIDEMYRETEENTEDKNSPHKGEQKDTSQDNRVNSDKPDEDEPSDEL